LIRVRRPELLKNAQGRANQPRRLRHVFFCFRKQAQSVEADGDATLVAETFLDFQALVVEPPRLFKIALALRELSQLMQDTRRVRVRPQFDERS
jgi:hypothetical protein